MSPISVSICLLLVILFEPTTDAAIHPHAANRPPQIMCTPDSLIFYQDCRMCVCPRPHKIARCYRKSCDLRTKDSGQCPVSVMKLDDSHLCPTSPTASCKVDNDCPGQQLCCFDFCNGTKCVSPAPLDISSGIPVHHGRGFP